MKQPSITFLSFFTKILLLMPFIYSACTTVTDTLYVQDVNVNGPINQPPIRLTGRDSSSFTISPKFFINSKKNYDGLVDGHTKVNSRGFFQVDTLNNGQVQLIVNRVKTILILMVRICIGLFLIIL